MITKKQLEILNVFKNNLFKEFSFSDLKRKSNEKSSSKLQKAINDFFSDGLINIKKIGRSKVISLNFENNKLFDYFSILQFEKSKMPFEVFYEIQKEILKETEFFCLVVFGSYASGKAGKKSDLDICIIVEESLKKKIIPRMRSIERKCVKKIHSEVFSREEFLEMLRQDEENVGKEIARNHFVFYGLINFYKLILKERIWKE
jgi:predicted nucleotidyltransferase